MLGFWTSVLCTLLSQHLVDSVPLSRRSGNLTNALDISSIGSPGDNAELIATICGQNPGAGTRSSSFNCHRWYRFGCLQQRYRRIYDLFGFSQLILRTIALAWNWQRTSHGIAIKEFQRLHSLGGVYR